MTGTPTGGGHERDASGDTHPRASTYVLADVRSALAGEPRVATLDLDVRLIGDTLVVSGEVTSDDQRRAVEEVVGTAAPDRPLRSEVTLLALHDPDEPEAIG